jgi:hypothetical protein
MKYLFIAILATLGLAACNQPVKGVNGEVYKSATDYNDYIVGRQTAIMKNVMDFVEVSQTNLDSAGKMLDIYVVDIDKMITEIKGMPAYKGDSTLRDAAVASFGFYKKIFANEYKQLIDIRQSGQAETQEGVDAMNAIVNKISTEEEKYDKDFHNAQRDFASKNNMKLKDNEMQDKIDKMNQ